MKRTLRGLACLAWGLAACTGEATVSEGDGGLEGTLVEEMRIDGYAHDLVPIGQLLVAEDGAVVMSQPQDDVVRFFDTEGTSLGAFGGEGEGPGEFSRIRRMGWRADTIWVWDLATSRMTLVSPDRELVRTQMVSRGIRDAPDEISEIADFAVVFPSSLRPDGRMSAGLAVPVGMSLSTGDGDQALVALMAPDGSFERILAQVSHGGQTAFSGPNGGGSVPFPNRGLITVSRDGARIAGASTSLQGVDSDSFTLTVWDADGANLFSRRYPFEPVPLPQAVVDSAYAARMEGLSPDLAEAFRRDVETPSVYPPLSRLIVGRDHSVWIEEVARNGTRPYLVVDPSGDPVGRLDLSEEARIAAADLEHVWVIERDAFDVESVVKYAVAWVERIGGQVR